MVGSSKKRFVKLFRFVGINYVPEAVPLVVFPILVVPDELDIFLIIFHMPKMGICAHPYERIVEEMI